jgi:hypothetical protein
MALTSPGIELTVIDESFYTPAAPGTVPMIFVATAQDKANPAGTGTAPGTLAANAGKPYLLTSQRDLAETFGDPDFQTDSNNNPINAGELNEYGLQAAYSLLGVSNRAYVVRADVDLAALAATSEAPSGPPSDGTYWFDAQNTSFGIFEWNGNSATTTGGQTFTVQDVIVITDATQLTANVPNGSVGALGSYAVVVTNTSNNIYYKTSSLTTPWVQVGTPEWSASIPVVRGGTPGTITIGPTISINTNLVASTGTTIEQVALDITGDTALVTLGISAKVVDGALEIYSTGVAVVIAEGDGLMALVSLTADTYNAPALNVSRHTQVPTFKTADDDRPSGSVWYKTTEPNAGAQWSVKVYNSDTQLFADVDAPLHRTNQSAVFELDRTGGGANLVVGDLYVKSNYEGESPPVADAKIYRRVTSGATTITSDVIATALVANTYDFSIQETIVGSEFLQTAKLITANITGATTDANVIATAINAAGFANIVASVNAQNRVVISHKLGGDFRIADTEGLLGNIGFSTTSTNLYAAPTGDIGNNDFVATLWQVLSYTATVAAPTSLTVQGTLWYSSVVDEVDIMVHNGTTWVGLLNEFAGADAQGPIVTATEPTLQRNGDPLVAGDIWIDTSDIENYPTVYKYNANTSVFDLIDTGDQTTEDGMLFADARYNTSGANSGTEGTIVDLLSSDYLDPDAPDPALYPKGMLLWNLRRSGFNVRRFEQNYIDTTALNGRLADESMSGYYANRWVTESANQTNGSGTFGRKAQRKVIIQQLQALVNSNDAIRDNESRIFNLLACPGYPELIGELISLNFDRGLTAFIVGDSPARLTPDATSLNEWGTNVNLAVEDNDDGLVSRDEYLGVYYPWGFTSDNSGNNVVVPPSHMMLRTIALNDQVAYPWFAPAGTRRGGITNASATGYVDAEGEFVSIALNEGQRDTLYENAINPITFITGAGLVAFGQKTRARNASSLDRINVARLVVYLRSRLDVLAKPYLFEPNDKITRDEIKQAAESLLLELVGQRALYDFLVVCDESNNTPARIDRSELYLDIAIEPVKAVEFIFIPLRLKNTGEISGLG